LAGICWVQNGLSARRGERSIPAGGLTKLWGGWHHELKPGFPFLVVAEVLVGWANQSISRWQKN
jgi:hypothetical protein